MPRWAHRHPQMFGTWKMVLKKFKNPQFVVDDRGHTLVTGMMQHDAQMVSYCEMYGVHSITDVEWEVYLLYWCENYI